MTNGQRRTSTAGPKLDSAWLDPVRSRPRPLAGCARAIGWVLAFVGAQVLPNPIVTGASVAALMSVGCRAGVGRAAVSLSLAREKSTPKDASVFIDEEFIGPLTFVAAHGVRLPVGEHRITIEKAGYFPWDRLVVADRQPIQLDVHLEPIPD